MIVLARRRGPRSINYRRSGVWSGLGDALSDFNAYESALAGAWANALTNGGVIVQPALPASMQSGTFAVPTSDCTLTNCVGPYSNPQANYAYWLDQTELPSSEPAGQVTHPIPIAVISKVVRNNMNVWGSPLNPYGPSVRAQGTSPNAASSNPASTASVASSAMANLQGGQVSFTSSRGGTALQVGDTWKITISGASPNSQVTVMGGKNGAGDVTPMGSTDASGSFSLSGQITADQIGSWSESWSVGGVPSGSFSFSVAEPSGSASTTPGGQVIINSSGAQNAPASSSAAPASSGFDFSSIPTWGWIAAAGVALFAMRGK